MAIADFFHSENIPDQVVESTRFARLIEKARLIGDNFVLPSRKRIGGDLLKLNFDKVYQANKTSLLKEAQVFGLGFMGDGATIKRTPFMNILAMCGGLNPTTISIQDCTNHIQDGGRKDAPYIATLFEQKVLEYDPHNFLTDVFFFDGASNVQKAGEILMAKFPHTSCFHGGEHVISLFFASIAKIEPIKVRGLPSLSFQHHVFFVSNHFFFPGVNSKDQQAIQCVWIWSQSWYPCPVHCGHGRCQWW